MLSPPIEALDFKKICNSAFLPTQESQSLFLAVICAHLEVADDSRIILLLFELILKSIAPCKAVFLTVADSLFGSVSRILMQQQSSEVQAKCQIVLGEIANIGTRGLELASPQLLTKLGFTKITRAAVYAARQSEDLPATTMVCRLIAKEFAAWMVGQLAENEVNKPFDGSDGSDKNAGYSRAISSGVSFSGPLITNLKKLQSYSLEGVAAIHTPRPLQPGRLGLGQTLTSTSFENDQSLSPKLVFTQPDKPTNLHTHTFGAPATPKTSHVSFNITPTYTPSPAPIPRTLPHQPVSITEESNDQNVAAADDAKEHGEAGHSPIIPIISITSNLLITPTGPTMRLSDDMTNSELRSTSL